MVESRELPLYEPVRSSEFKDDDEKTLTEEFFITKKNVGPPDKLHASIVKKHFLVYIQSLAVVKLLELPPVPAPPFDEYVASLISDWNLPDKFNSIVSELVTEPPEPDFNSRVQDVLFETCLPFVPASMAVSASVYVIVALRLVAGMDGIVDKALSKLAADHNSKNQSKLFNPARWMLQRRLRRAVANGQPVETVLAKDYVNPDASSLTVFLSDTENLYYHFSIDKNGTVTQHQGRNTNVFTSRNAGLFAFEQTEDMPLDLRKYNSPLSTTAEGIDRHALLKSARTDRDAFDVFTEDHCGASVKYSTSSSFVECLDGIEAILRSDLGGQTPSEVVHSLSDETKFIKFPGLMAYHLLRQSDVTVDMPLYSEDKKDGKFHRFCNISMALRWLIECEAKRLFLPYDDFLRILNHVYHLTCAGL